MIRQLTAQDIAAVLRVQKQAYHRELLERPESFLSKMRLFPRGAIGFFDSDVLAAYVFSHPWKFGEVVPIDAVLHSLPINVDCVYIHDLAVGSSYRGKGIAKNLLGAVFALSENLGITNYMLVAVQSSESFWNHYGFQSVRKLEYAPGINATTMARPQLAAGFFREGLLKRG